MMREMWKECYDNTERKQLTRPWPSGGQIQEKFQEERTRVLEERIPFVKVSRQRGERHNAFRRLDFRE